MLKITVPATSLWDEENEVFIDVKEQKLELEHSLLSLSKWESTWHKAFLNKRVRKTREESLDYIRCMTLTQNVDPNVYRCLTSDNIEKINAYIDDPMTATTVAKDKSSKGSNKIVTSEVIYSWMISLNIPDRFEKWHLNRLITLIEVCNAANTPPKKMNKNDIMRHNAQLNAANRKRFNSKG